MRPVAVKGNEQDRSGLTRQAIAPLPPRGAGKLEGGCPSSSVRRKDYLPILTVLLLVLSATFWSKVELTTLAVFVTSPREPLILS